MSETQLVGDMSQWVGMMKDFWRQVGDGSITEQQFQVFLEHRDPFAITDISQEWQEFYRKYFRITVDFSDVVIPDDPIGGFDRVIIIPKGLTFATVIKAMRKQFKVDLYTENLDKDVSENVRTPNKNYAVRVREFQEADDDLKNLSANELKEQNKNCLTLLERLMYEFKYWSETGEHLDINNWTLCAGSRRSDGDVPNVDWREGYRKLLVLWCSPGRAGGNLRARQAVS